MAWISVKLIGDPFRREDVPFINNKRPKAKIGNLYISANIYTSLLKLHIIKNVKSVGMLF